MASANMKTTPRVTIVTGLFRDRESAERAYQAACDRGYRSDEVNVAMSEETRRSWYPSNDAPGSDLGTKALEGTGAGAAIGGAVGGTLGALAALGTSLVIPGLGLIVAGPVAAGLAGAGAGGLTGGLIGALVGWGIPEDRAKTYETGLQQGGAVMGVAPRSGEDADDLRPAILSAVGLRSDLDRRPGGAGPSGDVYRGTGPDPARSRRTDHRRPASPSPGRRSVDSNPGNTFGPV
jgi:hypothetical protein